MKRRMVLLLGVALFVPLLMGVDKGCVTQPTIDTIVTTSSVAIKGTINELDSGGTLVGTRDGKVRLKVNGVDQAWVSTVSKVWTYSSVGLNTGVNTISGSTQRTVGSTTINGTLDAFILERKTDLVSRGEQKVFLDFSDSGIATQLKAIANHTLNGPLSAADQTAFVDGVKAKVTSYFKEAYKGMKITVVTAAGTDVTTVKFRGEDKCSLYGESPGDYKNSNKQQECKIYVGSFKCACVDDDRLLTETPARKTDTMTVRINDIGTFIGRTAVHEFGHSLGLTAEGDTKLHGCDGMHNCDAYDTANPADRFNSGHYIMDPGPKSGLCARIGLDCSEGTTTRVAKKPRFNSYNRSYLKIIHP